MPLSDKVSIPANTPEAKLVQYIQEKDRAPKFAQYAFEELYRRLSRNIYRHLVYLLQNENDAEDVLQETFAAVWFKPPQNNIAEESIVKWLRKVATNKAIDHLRRKDKVMFSSLPEDEPEESKPYTPLVSNEPDVGDQVCTHELLERVINQLRPGTRFIFLLYAQLGFSQADIEDITGIDQRRVSESICRARKYIRANMQERLQKDYPGLISDANITRKGGFSQ